jgi:1-acyl-sn-glycerol-3-phosphate acyltransferase
LPFHANLLQAAVQAGVPVVPVALRYRGPSGEFIGGPDGAIHFVGEIGFLSSVWRLLGAPGVMAELHRLPEIAVDPTPDNRVRHRLADEARQRIRTALDLPLEDTLPDGLRDLRAVRR